MDDGPAEVEAMRADLYALLARLLARPADAALLELAGRLSGADDTPLGAALAELARAARTADPDAVEAEYTELFVGLGQGAVLPYASHYLVGFLNDKPLAKLRGDLAELGVEARPDNCEPEDHIAALCDTMAGLIVGAFGAPAPLDRQRRFFEAHLAPWAERLFVDIDAAAAAGFYRAVAGFGRAFVAVEAEAFTLG